MAQNQNGFNRRSTSATRTYPGTAARLSVAAATTPLVDGFSPTNRSRPNTESAPTVFVRPLSRSQLAPVHGVGNGGGRMTSTASLLNESSSRRGLPPPIIATRPISLETPRPDSERHRNLYLGAPISLNSGSGIGSHSPANNNPANSSLKDYSDSSSSVTAAEQVRLPTSSRTSKNKGHSDRNSLDGSKATVVTLQPGKRTLLDSSTGGGGTQESGKVKLPESSIMCPYCRKCRCEACSTPRPLPSRWICSESIHCGPEPLLDYITCLCCVKAVFYHCGKNHEPDGGVMCADKPCSCAPHRKFWRWGCMTAMSLVFPCLCLYWPCKGCIRLTEKVYQRYHSHGCTCTHPTTVSKLSSLPVPVPSGEMESSEEEEEQERYHHHHRPPVPRHVPIPPQQKQVIVPHPLTSNNATFLPVKQTK